MEILWNRYCVSIGSFVTAVIRLPNSSMNSMACMSHVLPVSIATRTRNFGVCQMLKLGRLCFGSMIGRCSCHQNCSVFLDDSSTCDCANVSDTVTSQVRAFSHAQGINVAPSGRLPSYRDRPTGSFTAGIWALFTALQIMSFRSECLCFAARACVRFTRSCTKSCANRDSLCQHLYRVRMYINVSLLKFQRMHWPIHFKVLSSSQ